MLNLKIFEFIFDAIAYYCKEIDPKTTNDARYIPCKIVIKKKSDSNECSSCIKFNLNSNTNFKSILFDVTHSMSKFEPETKVEVMLAYQNINDSKFLKKKYYTITMSREMYFTLPEDSNILFSDYSEEKQYTYEWINNNLVEYVDVYDSTLFNQIKSILSTWKDARTIFINSFSGNDFIYGLPDYQSIVVYLDAYYNMLIKLIDLLKSYYSQNLLNFNGEPSLLDIILNTDCSIDKNNEYNISFLNPFILHSYFTSMIFASYQAGFDKGILEKIENILYKINSDIMMTQVINNFNNTLFYKSYRYFVEPIYKTNNNNIDYMLKVTREDKLQSYTLIEPIRLYEKILAALENDFKDAKQTKIALFGYISDFSLNDLMELLMSKLKDKSILFNIYKFNNVEFNDISAYSINGKINFEINNEIFELNKESVRNLYNNNDIVFFLDTPFLYKQTLEKNIKSNVAFLLGLHKGKYSSNLDMLSIINGVGGKYGDFVSTYNYLNSLNKKYKDNYDLFNYAFDECKYSKFTAMLSDEKVKKDVILYFFVSDENTINASSDTFYNICREEYYESKRITIIRAMKNTDHKIYELSKIIPITLWQIFKSLSSTVYVNIWSELRGLNKEIKRFEIVEFLSSCFIGVDYSKIDKIKINLYLNDKLSEIKKFDNCLDFDKKEIEKIAKRITSKYFLPPQKENENNYFLDRTAFLKNSIYFKFYTLIYNGCTCINDIIFVYLYNHYKNLLVKEDFKYYSDEELYKDISDKYESRILYNRKKEDYDTIQNLSIPDYYMLSKNVIKDLQGFKSDMEYKNFVKNINAVCIDINALNTNLYVNTSKELK